MWPYLAVPTCLMELLWNCFTLSWAVERWNLSSVPLLLSLFLKSIGENLVTKIIWFLNVRHSSTLFGVCFLTSTQQMLPSVLPSNLLPTLGTTQVMYIAKLKDGPKRAKKTFLMILERVFKMVWWKGRKWNHIKKDIFEIEVFFSSQNIVFPFIWRLELFFFFLFYFLFSIIFLSLLFLCFVSWGLGGFDDI
jgi:hypothetical protein